MESKQRLEADKERHELIMDKNITKNKNRGIEEDRSRIKIVVGVFQKFEEFMKASHEEVMRGRKEMRRKKHIR